MAFVNHLILQYQIEIQLKSEKYHIYFDFALLYALTDRVNKFVALLRVHMEVLDYWLL